ncbi:hypothetical protein [Chryseobacterium sp. POE27]|uniref:hypothetical protein n=1 Tax=Chryseobacterium sp. POE27 TaxID=3138177 RepID=UPI003218E40B
MKNNMLNKLKSGYEELEIKPSSELWSKLEQKLEEKPEIISEKPFEWWKYAAVVLLFISLGAIFYFNSLSNNFNYKETDYTIRKVLHKTVNPINPEFQNRMGVKETDLTESNKKVVVQHQKISTDPVLLPESEHKITITKPLDIKTQNVTVSQDKKMTIKPPKIENQIPVIAEVKKTRPTYINSSELLLGREFDKASGNYDKKDIKIGILNFDKPVPDVENVTVLGVTVYVESK